MEHTKNPFKDSNIAHDEDAEVNNNDDINNSVAEDPTVDLNEQEVQDEDNSEQETDAKYEELNNKYIRLAADFDNFRKRTVAEKDELSKYTTVQLLKKLTVILDTFDRARESLKDIQDSKTVKEGYEVAYKQLLDTLSKIGLVEMDALGAQFNPNEHEAITQVETDEYEPDTVAVVAQKGYMYQDKVVRPALVGVAKNKENE